jgi:acyl-CoA synthetase (AMP-forming)/AMP-acid ligase II
MRGVPDILATFAAKHPGKAAVIDDRPGLPVVAYTYAELHARSNQLAALLVDLGVTPGTKVVSCGQNSAGLLLAVHGIRKAGAVGVPLNYHLSPAMAAYVVDNSDAEVVLVDAEYAELIERIGPETPKVAQVLVFDGNGDLERRLDTYPTNDIELSGAVSGTAMIYTSGTTGQPKGVVRNGPTDPAQVGRLLDLIGFQPDDIHLTTGPLYHSGPGGFAQRALSLGNTVVVQHKFDAEDWLRLVDTYRVTTTFTAPTPIRRICTLPAEVKARYARSSMRRLIANAAPWSLALKKLYLADFPPDSLFEVYGATELGVVTVLGPDDHLRKPGSCGLAVPGVEIRLIDDEGREVTEPHVMGELCVRAAGVFDTYYKADDLYQADRRGDFQTVGDVAYVDEDGYFYIADRKRDMIISGGVNIYPAQVEAALDQSPDVFEVAVIGVPSEEWGESVHAVVVPAHPGVTEADVVAFARQHLAGYETPRSVSFVDELPKTGSGKVLKRELRAPFWADPGAGHHVTPGQRSAARPSDPA